MTDVTDEPAVCLREDCDLPALGKGTGKDYCSQRHAHTAWRIRTGRLVLLELKYCAYPPCGLEFRPRLPWQNYCTQACREAHYKTKTKGGVNVRTAKARATSRPTSTRRAEKWRSANPDRAREHQRNRVLRDKGLTAEGHAALVEQFEGGCWICRRPGAERTRGGRVRRLHIDHDHAHAEGDPAGVRGLLDTWCNTRLAIVENPDLVTRLRAYLAARAEYMPAAAGPDDLKSLNRWYRFGLTDEQYDAMRAACDHRCEVCGTPELEAPRQKLQVDHAHTKAKGTPGFIRGLLCNTCNSALSVVENEVWWAKAVDYLTWAHPLAQRLIAEAA